jgi:glutaredoxin 3
MQQVTIYTTRVCGYCLAAKRLLGVRGIPFTEVDVSSDPEKRAWLVDATGQRTVPQVFIGDESVGGYDELAALDRAGRLRPMVEGSAPASPGATEA